MYSRYPSSSIDFSWHPSVRQDSRSRDSRRRESPPPRRRSRSRDRYRQPRLRSRSPTPPRGRSPHRSRSPPRRSRSSSMPTEKSRHLREQMDIYFHDVEGLRTRKDLVDFLWRSGMDQLTEDDKPTLFNQVVAVKPGIVGVDSLYQVLCFDKPSFETYYCSMCSWWTTASDMFGHLVSHPHRMAHLQRRYSSFHKSVEDEPDSKNRQHMVAYYAEQISKSEGCGIVGFRLKCVLSMKTISRLWPDYEMYVDNAWKLTDIANALLMNQPQIAFNNSPFHNEIDIRRSPPPIAPFEPHVTNMATTWENPSFVDESWAPPPLQAADEADLLAVSDVLEAEVVIALGVQDPGVETLEAGPERDLQDERSRNHGKRKRRHS
ncbi:hypothetical protein L596_025906 [Steinernema carpocapsae]|uniref:Uncharacterized protein n=1 Tax=Steinernema carpocapsae TaxID=34508 RepID=A0A4V5ZYY9_STECR|nr:hypothetical protein L596_025906 [Steinernema carpocapsae]